jgi:hypothetical protein
VVDGARQPEPERLARRMPEAGAADEGGVDTEPGQLYCVWQAVTRDGLRWLLSVRKVQFSSGRRG